MTAKWNYTLTVHVFLVFGSSNEVSYGAFMALLPFPSTNGYGWLPTQFKTLEMNHIFLNGLSSNSAVKISKGRPQGIAFQNAFQESKQGGKFNVIDVSFGIIEKTQRG